MLFVLAKLDSRDPVDVFGICRGRYLLLGQSDRESLVLGLEGVIRFSLFDLLSLKGLNELNGTYGFGYWSEWLYKH